LATVRIEDRAAATKNEKPRTNQKKPTPEGVGIAKRGEGFWKKPISP